MSDMVQISPGSCELTYWGSNPETGEVEWGPFTTHNITTYGGRKIDLNNIYGLSASSTICAFAIGACSTPSAAVGDTQLGFELVGNPQRYTLTNISGALLTSNDIVQGSYSNPSVTGFTFYETLPIQVIMPATSLNDGQPVGEVGLTNSTVLPATTMGSPIQVASGTLYNHIVLPAPFTKQVNQQVNFVLNHRF